VQPTVAQDTVELGRGSLWKVCGAQHVTGTEPNNKAMWSLGVATVINGQSAQSVGASLLAMLLPSGRRRGLLMMHLLNPDRQQAGSYKGLRAPPTVNRYRAKQTGQSFDWPVCC